MTGDERSVFVEVEMPEDHVKILDNCVKDGKINMEIDKIHGFDPAMNRRDVWSSREIKNWGLIDQVKISRFSVIEPPVMPRNTNLNGTIEALEEKIIEVEVRERARTIDIKGMLLNPLFKTI